MKKAIKLNIMLKDNYIGNIFRFADLFLEDLSKDNFHYFQSYNLICQAYVFLFNIKQETDILSLNNFYELLMCKNTDDLLSSINYDEINDIHYKNSINYFKNYINDNSYSFIVKSLISIYILEDRFMEK